MVDRLLAEPACHAGPRSINLEGTSDEENSQRTKSCEAFKPSLFPAAQQLRSTTRCSHRRGAVLVPLRGSRLLARRGYWVVSCDMKLHSILLGWMGILTKPCVSPQVFHGSMRLTGYGRVAVTVRGVKPSRQWSKPGSLNPGAN